MPGDGRDALEVVVEVEQCEIVKLRGRRDEQVDRTRTAMLAAIQEFLLHLTSPREHSLIGGDPAEQTEEDLLDLATVLPRLRGS
nr:hypothetical protein [Glycomyces harbinensis]